MELLLIRILRKLRRLLLPPTVQRPSRRNLPRGGRRGGRRRLDVVRGIGRDDEAAVAVGEEERAAVDESDTACSQEALGLEKDIEVVVGEHREEGNDVQHLALERAADWM